MTAGDHLSEQFEMVHPKEIGYLQSRDHSGTLKDLKFDPKGEHADRVKEIMESAKTEGIREPLDVRMGPMTPYLHDGHHRYMAAKKLGIEVPVKRSGGGYNAT